MNKSSTSFFALQRAADGESAAGRGGGNGLMRAERTPGNGVVVADGDRTRYPGGTYDGT